jgi:PST family polysaccharide transporter
MSRSENFERFAGTEAVSGDLKRKSVMGALMTGAGGALDFVLRLASTLILARLLVPEHFGLVAMVTILTRIAESVATLGLSTTTVQTQEINHRQCSNLFWVNAALGVFLAAMLVLFSPVIASFYGDERLQTISLALSLSFVFTGLSVQHEALLRRQMKLPQVAGNRLAATFVSVCLAIGLALGGFGYWALVWKEVAQSFLIAFGSWTLCPWLPAGPSRHANMHRLLRFGRDMTVTQLLLATSAQFDSLLIGKIAGAADLGLYRQAHNLMKAPIDRLNAPIFSVSQPGLSILQGEPGRYRRYYRRILLVVSMATVPLGVFTAIYAHEIVVVALGQKWVGAVVFLRIFGLAAAIQPALGTTGIVTITCGNSGRFFVVSLVYNATMVILMFTGIRWGAVGIATARVASLVLLMPWALYYGFAGTPVSVGDFFRSVSRPFIATVTMAAALLLLRYYADLESDLLSLAAGCGAAVPLYFLAFILLPGGRTQLQSLVNELLGALRKRSSIRVEASRDAT